MVEKRVLVWVVVLFCVPFVFAMQSGLISDCTIVNVSSGCDASNNFTAVGRISDDGHYSNILVNPMYPYYLCCRNFDSVGSGVISFRYANGVNGSGHVSVNSSLTMFQGTVKLGFPNSCYLKQGACNHGASEVCIFRVSNSSDLNPSNWKYVADSAHVSDCNNNGNPRNEQPNSFPNNLCCKFDEICNDGIDNDFDGYIDCADQDCNNFGTANPPKFCTGSPYISSVCANVTRYPNGTNYNYTNPLCKGQSPHDSTYFYCSYGRINAPGTPGLCCPAGTYTEFDTITNMWICQVAEKCGLGSPGQCYYDFDLNNMLWRNSAYNGSTNSLWCQSKMPDLYSPDPDSYSPRKSNGCCLIAQNGKVDYYTDPGNVKIFGYQHVCGDGIIDPGEQCDGPITNTTCSNYIASCPSGYVVAGSLVCSSTCQINHANCHCVLNNQI